jgi:CheY-like chemotaxis protein
VRKTILLVEDDPDTRIILQDALAGRGHRVLTAVQGAEGVHMARRYTPDLIITDLRMPLMDGLSAVRYMRSLPETKLIPIWVLSGYLEDLSGQGDALGFERLIAKPFDPAVLADEVEARIGPSRE